MADNSIVIGNICPDAEMHVVIDLLGLAPLLKFHDDNVFLVLLIGADDDEINAL
jgi:hypothetical protein